MEITEFDFTDNYIGKTVFLEMTLADNSLVGVSLTVLQDNTLLSLIDWLLSRKIIPANKNKLIVNVSNIISMKITNVEDYIE